MISFSLSGVSSGRTLGVRRARRKGLAGRGWRAAPGAGKAGGMILDGPRLRLRPWRAAEDAGAFAAMNADPEVMRHFAGRLRREESDALEIQVKVLSDRLKEEGYAS